MILALLYHRIGSGRRCINYHLLHDHLSYIADTYPVILPGEQISPKQYSLCLTFDDASYDFYHLIFPLLKKFNLRALLAVPTKYINDRASNNSATRLEVPYYEAMNDGVYQRKDPFCSWEELAEMTSTPHVAVASHSHSHVDMTSFKTCVKQELTLSKELLEHHLGKKVSTFVYPFGKTSPSIHTAVMSQYDRGMRIGGAGNKDWHNSKGLLYRICCDNMSHPLEHLRMTKRLQYRVKYFINELR